MTLSYAELDNLGSTELRGILSSMGRNRLPGPFMAEVKRLARDLSDPHNAPEEYRYAVLIQHVLDKRFAQALVESDKPENSGVTLRPDGSLESCPA